MVEVVGRQAGRQEVAEFHVGQSDRQDTHCLFPHWLVSCHPEAGRDMDWGRKRRRRERRRLE